MLPTENRIFQFEKSHASVVYKAEHSEATGTILHSLKVMVIDAYRYQREFSVRHTWEPGDSNKLYWEWGIYQHPGVRAGGKVSKEVATRFITRFLYLADKYPTLLFNPDDERMARCEGFVHMAMALHAGAEFTHKLLD